MQTSLADPFREFGRSVLAPVMAPFARWVAGHSEGRPVFGIMRDGGFLVRLVKEIAPTPGGGEVWLGRRLCLLAAIRDGADGDRLLDLLVRARGRPATLAEALGELGLAEGDGPDGMQPGDRLDPIRFPVFAAWLAGDCRAVTAVADQSARVRAGILAHLRRQGALEGDGLTLVDVGYAGNIGRTLALIFAMEGLSVPVRGLYLVTSPGIAWARAAGCRAEGFLADAGFPEPFGPLFIRHREVVESLCASSAGPLTGYGSDGEPLCGTPHLPQAQREQVARVQAAALEAATATEWEGAEAARLVLTRLFTAPTRWEAEVLGRWVYEDSLATNGKRILAESGYGRLLWPEAASLPGP